MGSVYFVERIGNAGAWMVGNICLGNICVCVMELNTEKKKIKVRSLRIKIKFNSW